MTACCQTMTLVGFFLGFRPSADFTFRDAPRTEVLSEKVSTPLLATPLCFRCTSMLSRGSLAGLLHPAASCGVRILSSSTPSSVAVANLRCGPLGFPDCAGSRPSKSSPRQQPMSVSEPLGLLAVDSLSRRLRSEKLYRWSREPRLQGVAPLTSPFCAAVLLPTAQSILPWVCFPLQGFPATLRVSPASSDGASPRFKLRPSMLNRRTLAAPFASALRPPLPSLSPVDSRPAPPMAGRSVALRSSPGVPVVAPLRRSALTLLPKQSGLRFRRGSRLPSWGCSTSKIIPRSDPSVKHQVCPGAACCVCRMRANFLIS